MAGICGIVLSQSSDRLSEERFHPMVRALGPGSTDSLETLVAGAAALGAGPFPGRTTGVASVTVHGACVGLAFHGTLLASPITQHGARPQKAFLEILDRYIQQGLKVLDQLRGEFALAIWDGRTETLHVATDRFRVHPIVYYAGTDRLIFASRMKALERAPVDWPRTINPEAIVDVAGNSYAPTPTTIFVEAHKLPPGHVLSYRQGTAQSVRYWDLDFTHPRWSSEQDLARELKDRFSDAISSRVKAELPGRSAGTFLSGGVDSSTVTGVLTQVMGTPITAFSIGFDVERFNEITYARTAARAFGAKHVEYFVTPADVFEAIPHIVGQFDEPFANASAVPTYFCAKVAREHGIDTLYAGDGGDELFAGNERYASQRVFDYYWEIPSLLRNGLVKPLAFGLAAVLPFGPFTKGKKYIQRASIPYPDRLYSYGTYRIISQEDLFDPAFLRSLGRVYNPYWAMHWHYERARGRTELDKQLYLDLKLAISDNDLFKVTRMTEANGVSVKFPFLDQYLAEFASCVPSEIRMRGQRLRSFFKNAYADLLPAEIIQKTKHGFGLPIPVWLRTDRKLNELMMDLVLSPQSVQRGIFSKTALERLIASHRDDQTSFYGTLLWNLMVLELWFRR
jgi:asparagine synthase (glutamine-hydrolysing)